MEDETIYLKLKSCCIKVNFFEEMSCRILSCPVESCPLVKMSSMNQAWSDIWRQQIVCHLWANITTTQEEFAFKKETIIFTLN